MVADTEKQIIVRKRQFNFFTLSVYVVFACGEIILTKGGELFGQRSYHSCSRPLLHETWLNFECETKVLGYPGAVVSSLEEGLELSKKLFNIWCGIINEHVESRI